MKSPNNLYLLILLLLFCEPVRAQQDTLRLSHAQFLEIVKRYHPLAFRYRLANELAEAEVLRARGNFDPFLDAKNGAKTIDGTDYYQQTNAGISIPTWYGIQLNGGYNYIDGERLNNSDTRGGLYQFGFTLPLAKNLIYDRRRALLDQAKYAVNMTAAEQRLLTNDLLLEADNAYWQWVMRYEVFRLQREAVSVNRERLMLTRKSYEYGERAAIDTTEALSQLQSFELKANEAYLQFVKATQELSLFLWREQQQPYDIVAGLVPEERITDPEAYYQYPRLLEELGTQSFGQHNALLYYSEKQRILESERRLKQQSFLPKLDFSYNFFNKQSYRPEYFPLFADNYQYALKLEIPLFLRQARGDYRMAKIKIEQNELDRAVKQMELTTKINTYRNEVQSYREQINIAEQNIRNYQRLVQAEDARYANGESSLFLINSRENKLIEAQEKMLELRLKFLKGYNQLKWLNENFKER